MSIAPPGDAAFGFELCKLLVQVAWADDDVAPEEIAALEAFAATLGLDAEQRGELDAALRGTGPLPPPNLGLLKARKVEVFRAVRQLLASDARIHEDEQALLAELTTILR